MQMQEVSLETERLLLRWFRETDFPEYLAMSSDPEVMKFLGGKPQTEIEAWKSMAAFMGHWYFRGYGVWAVEEKSTGKLIGRIGLMNPAGWPGFELGWTLARESWGKGYATELTIAGLHYVFTKTQINPIYAYTEEPNTSSQKVLLKAGFRPNGSYIEGDKKVEGFVLEKEEYLRRNYLQG